MFGSTNANLGSQGFGAANPGNPGSQQLAFAPGAAANPSPFGSTFGLSFGAGQNTTLAQEPASSLGGNTAAGGSSSFPIAANANANTNANSVAQPAPFSAVSNKASANPVALPFGGSSVNNSASGPLQYGSSGATPAAPLPFVSTQSGAQSGLTLFGNKPTTHVSGATPGFGQANANVSQRSVQPSSGMFGGNADTNSAPKPFTFGTSNTLTASCFGGQASASTETTPQPGNPNPAPSGGLFSGAFKNSTSALGGSSTPSNNAPAFTFGNKDSGAAAPSSSFGALASTGNDGKSLGLFGGAKSAENKAPLFGGNPISNAAPLFGNKPADLKSGETSSLAFESLSTSKPGTPSLSFGAKPANESEPKVPAFSSGAASGDKTESKAPTFSFGAKTDERKDDKALAFSFGSKPEERKEDKASAFAVGAKSSDSAPAEKPSFSFGAKPAENSNTTTTDAAKSAPGPCFSFGAKSDNKSLTEKPAFSFGANLDEKKNDKEKPSLFSLGTKPDDKSHGDKPAFSFGKKPAEDTSVDSSKKAPAFSFGSGSTEKKADKAPELFFGAKADDKKDSKASDAKNDKPSETEQPNKNLTNLKYTQVKPIPVSLDNKTMDDLVMKWSKQLAITSGIFDKFTDKVKEWDLQLAKSGEDITKLHNDTMEVDALHQRIDQQLVFVEGQQDELDRILDNYEQQAEILLNNIETSKAENALVPSGGASSSSSSDITDELRAKAYNNAKLLDERLDSLGSNLGALVAEINCVSGAFNKSLLENVSGQDGKGSESSLEEIVKLLNFHLDNLKYIESTKDVLEQKLAQVKGQRKVH